MKDDQNPSDYIAPPNSLPPAGKISREIFAGLERLGKELGLPVLCLLAGHWGLLDPKEAGLIFVASISTVLGGNFALRRAESKANG